MLTSKIHPTLREFPRHPPPAALSEHRAYPSSSHTMIFVSLALKTRLRSLKTGLWALKTTVGLEDTIVGLEDTIVGLEDTIVAELRSSARTEGHH